MLMAELPPPVRFHHYGLSSFYISSGSLLTLLLKEGGEEASGSGLGGSGITTHPTSLPRKYDSTFAHAEILTKRDNDAESKRQVASCLALVAIG